jgi:hypothetical protein
LFSTILLLLAYTVAEVGFSVGTYALSPASFWVYEDSGRTVHFDAVRGYRLTQVPSRCARIVNGTVEYVATSVGNNQGFPDRDDFNALRTSGGSVRLAVFGDSFTAAQFIDCNWPDRVEELTAATNQRIELLNVAVDGAGLANWHSVLTRLIDAEDYQLDGLVFAVYGDDLRRGFSIAEHRGYSRHMFGRLQGKSPEEYPTSLDEARQYLLARDGYIVSSDQFDRAIDGRWKPLRPVLTDLLRHEVDRFWRRVQRKINPQPPQAVDGRLVSDIREYLARKGMPCLVVRVPSREELVESIESNPKDEIVRFADDLSARYVDGATAFRELSTDEVKAHWFPNDGHWNQRGSDRFAEFMAQVLAEWPPQRGIVRDFGRE